MRNDIKRFFVAVLAACGLAVSAAQADRCPVAFSASAGGSVSSAGGQYNSGETVMCTATPAAGSRFVKWSGDVDEFHHHAPTLSVTVGTNALSYSASFAPMEEGEVALDYRGMCFPSNYMKNTVLFGYARNIWDMIEFDGKIYSTYGNASNYGPGYSGNSGAVTFGLIDPLTDALSLDYTTGEDQVRSFRIGDNGNLYAPGLDACGQGSTTYLYTRAKGGDWTKRIGGANTHMCDAIEWNGYEVAANRFSTNGSGFNAPNPNSGNGDNAYLPFSANLYYAAESMFRFAPNGASSYWVTTQMKQNGTANKYDLYPGFAYHKFDDVCFPCIGFKPYRPIRYGDSVLYGAAVRHNDHQHLPVNTSLFMASENTQAASSSDPELVVRTVQIGALTNMVSYTNTMAVGTTRTRTWDFLVKEQGERKIVLALIEQQTDRGCTTPTLMFVYASEGDLSEWREIFRFRTPEGTFARSFEYANGKFYFGLGSEADVGKGNQPNWMPLCSLNEKGASIYTGEIYSYAYDLFDEGNNPPALPTAAFASAAQTVQENAGTVSISVVLSQASSSAVSIPFTLGGTALAGTDYQISASPLTIPAGQTSGTIDIVLAADGLAEPAETISVVLGTPTGATLGATTTHTLTVAASEAPPPALPTAAFASAAQTVLENAGTVSIPVVLSQACNANGEVIGITNMKIASSSVEGMGFAIPISTALEYANHFLSGDPIIRPYLGVSMYDLSSNYYSSQTGIYIQSVESGSPAEKAGLQKGDVISAIDGKEVSSTAYLKYELYKHNVGDEVEITYTRNNKKNTTKVTLGSYDITT